MYHSRFSFLYFPALVLCCSLFLQPQAFGAEDAPAAEGSTAAADAPTEAAAPKGPPTNAALGEMDSTLAFAIDNMFLFVCAVLVLFMQAGFAMVEAGFNQAKNVVNILFKNIMDLSIGMLLFFLVGVGLMYPGEFNGVIGFAGVGVSDWDGVMAAGALHPQVDWLFQAAFAATAATIVSGAVAGRMRFSAYLIYSAILTALIYPISGSWQWGGGWLSGMGFHDFAGSLLVHAVGGFAGLAGAIVLGPRLGRFSADGKAQPMPGHNLAIAALGVFILWIGWYGFNPGSQLAIVGLTDSGASNTAAVMTIAVNTSLAAGAGVVLAMLVSWGLFRKPDLSMALNGALAGLVGITANCDCVTNIESVIIGAVAGVLVVFGVVLLDKLKIDDPVGAWPVHGLCGIWGGIATGLFGEGKILWVQAVGTLAICAWAFFTMLALFLVLRVVGILRVNPEEEQQGLDLSEHGMHAYESSV
ncbi:MAG: ammonium transporter [Planctomycetales bacterium]